MSPSPAYVPRAENKLLISAKSAANIALFSAKSAVIRILRHTCRVDGEQRYIWQLDDWPCWRYDAKVLAERLAEVSRSQGVLLGRLHNVGIEVQDTLHLSVFTQDVMKSSEIEGEHLDVLSVRSSIARRIGVDIGALAPADRSVEGVVEMVLDAAHRCSAPLTKERLFAWHAGLFPHGYSGSRSIRVADWRDDVQGPMQVVSGAIGRERVHFEAPPADGLDAEINRFLDWINADTGEQLLLKAGIAHLWFVTLHPFDDGNGRIARAVGEILLARADGQGQRFYSLSAQLQRERNEYYSLLERTQQGTLDVTKWLSWFLDVLSRSVENAQKTLDDVLAKSIFWQSLQGVPLNQRQVLLLNRLLDGFEGKLTAKKWATITKSSSDSALRDIQQLIERGILKKSLEGGRSTSYELISRALSKDITGHRE
jgi:Fic family protein